ncbi:MAG: hypothetical protein MJ070_01990 [Lachnospiraceae bacterium]|nr:hypothetical protein [Lachnospiraceae bacterium]
MADNSDKKTAFLNTLKKASDKISETTSAFSEGVKETAVQVRTNIEKKQEERRLSIAEKKKEEEIGNLVPIYNDDLSPEQFQNERVIRIINYDSRLEYDELKGAVGFYELTQDRKIPTILSKYVPILRFSFYPLLNDTLYIADPCISGKYIEADQYYNYMKQVRVNELLIVAQSLGAKKVKICYTDTSKSADSRGKGIHLNSSGLLNAKAGKENKGKEKNSVNIWADTAFKTSLWGSDPVVPNLLYFRNESDINSLIQMVLDSKSKLKSHTYHLQASSSSGLALSEAVSIEGAMKMGKINVGMNLGAEAEKESKSVLEYTIEF